jgi:hypothetical protein
MLIVTQASERIPDTNTMSSDASLTAWAEGTRLLQRRRFAELNHEGVRFYDRNVNKTRQMECGHLLELEDTQIHTPGRDNHMMDLGEWPSPPDGIGSRNNFTEEHPSVSAPVIVRSPRHCVNKTRTLGQKG